MKEVEAVLRATTRGERLLLNVGGQIPVKVGLTKRQFLVRRRLSSTERAHALIALAHPEFRDELKVSAKACT